MIEFQKNGVDAVFLPYLGQNGEQWLMTTPNFQVALNRNLEKDETRRKKAMKVLNVMLSEEAQNVLSKGGDVITYSQNLDLHLSPCLNTAARMAPFLKDESRVFEREQQQIRPEWTDYILNGGTLAEPENYITLY